MGKNGEIAKKVSELVGEIAAASREQAQGISQVNTAVAEMDKVAQQTAASAEESASAAEEMNAQAEQMKSYIGDLVTLIGGQDDRSTGVAVGPAANRRIMKHNSVVKPMTPVKQDQKALVSPEKGKVVRPDQIIPMEEEEFKDF